MGQNQKKREEMASENGGGLEKTGMLADSIGGEVEGWPGVGIGTAAVSGNLDDSFERAAGDIDEVGGCNRRRVRRKA